MEAVRRNAYGYRRVTLLPTRACVQQFAAAGAAHHRHDALSTFFLNEDRNGRHANVRYRREKNRAVAGCHAHIAAAVGL